MPIFYNEQTQEFHIQGNDFSYLLNVMENNQLGQIYYGKKVRHRSSFKHLIQTPPRVTLSCVYEGDLEFSLETLKQEYPSYGTTDYREPAYQVEQEDGSRITDLQYKRHKIQKGKPSLEGLPATYVEHDEEATTLEIVLYDELIDMEVRLLYTLFENTNILTRSARFSNEGQQHLKLTRVMSTSVDLFDSDYNWLQLSGAWARERHIETRPLQSGIQKISSTRGTSSSQHNPFVALMRKDATEDQGEVFGFSLVYSGNFIAQAEVDHYDTTRFTMGLNPFDFNWLLSPDESFQTPEAVMVYSDQGLNKMSQTFHSLYKERLARGYWKDKARPVLINNWEATYFDFDERKIVDIASQANELGVELFVLDDGWFGNRNDDTTSLGDWYSDDSKLPNGVKSVAEKITDLGMMFGLWFEPEMVSKQSDLYQTHPDWLIHVKGRHLSHGRNQYILDFSRQEVVDYIYEQMSSMLTDANISYVKWDMNRYMTEIGSATLPADRQQEVAHRYILGVYQLYERLTTTFPYVLFESCASGGARFDPGMLYYAPQAWTSDNTDAIERLKIQYGTSMVYPLSSIGAHVSAVPNHQVKRTTSLSTRGDVAFFGTFGYELDITQMSEQEKQHIKEQIVFYKEHRELIQNGHFYRLKSPFSKDGKETAWMVVSQDQSQAIVGYYQVLAKSNPGLSRLPLKGLKEEYSYTIFDSNLELFGDELMNIGLQLEESYIGNQAGEITESGDFSSRVYYLKAVPVETDSHQAQQDW